MDTGTTDPTFIAFVLGFALAGFVAMIIIRLFAKRFLKLLKDVQRSDES